MLKNMRNIRKIPFVVLCAFIALLFCTYTGAVEVSLSDCLLWGPGLSVGMDLPVGYFYIQVVGESGINVTQSLGEKAFSVNFNSPAGDRLRIWSQVKDRQDGSYLVRYKLFGSYDNLKIDVLYNHRHVANSPYTLEGMTYHEKCYCPEPSINTWLKNMQCPKSYTQIIQDLSIFPEVNMENVETEAVARFNQRGAHSLCHYVIKDNKIFRKTYGLHVGFKKYMDEPLLSLTRKVKLPDMEFFVNLGDWPLEKRFVKDNPLPIFSWCGSNDTRDIVMPTYDHTEAILECMGRVSLDMLSVQGETGPRWENKSNTAFWRGRDSRQERLDLVKLSRQYPDIIDAKLTNMFFFKHSEDLGEIVKRVSFFDFFKYKYQISLDGTVAAYRLPYLLAGDSVILKQDSPYYEYFYKRLKPYVHYIPIRRNISDLLEQIEWAKQHDEEVKQIALNAQEFAREHLQGKDVFCYYVMLLNEYSTRLVVESYVREGMELVEQPDDHESKCNCKREELKKEEL